MQGPDLGHLLDKSYFYCVFCKELSTFRTKQHKEYKDHVETVHNISDELNTVYSLNFLCITEKEDLIREAKQCIKKGDIFSCGLCSDDQFVFGELLLFKKHLEKKHAISYEFEILLAWSLLSVAAKTKICLKVKEKLLYKIKKYSTKQPNYLFITENTDISSLAKTTNLSDLPFDDNLLLQGGSNCTTNINQNKSVKLFQDGLETKNDVSEAFSQEEQENKSHEEKTIINRNDQKCMYCSFVSFEKQVKTHMRKNHFVCMICETKFDCSNNLQIHFDLEHFVSNERMRCSINGCDKVYSSSNSSQHIYHHIRRDHNGVRYICDELVQGSRCNQLFRSKSVLHSHQKKHFPETKVAQAKVPCTVCGIIINKFSLKKHLYNAHSNLPLVSCSKCSFSTKNHDYLVIHEQGHIERAKCNLCEFSTTNQRYLKQHIEFKHEGGAVYQCTKCDYKTGRPNHFKIHEQTHGERKYKCDICSFTGKSKGSVKTHNKRHQDPKYVCQDCGYKTYDYSNFSTHKVQRHGDVILVCENCDFRTKSKRTLKQHIQKKHELA